MATQVISPTRLDELMAKYQERTLSQAEYVEYRQLKDGVDVAYAKRMFATAYQALKIPAEARSLMAV